MQGKFLHRQVDYAAALIGEYEYEEPFHLYLKKYFQQNKRHGSRDRKNISELCYGYFRLGNGVMVSGNVEDAILLGYYLFHEFDSGLLSKKPDWQKTVARSLEDKLKLVKSIFDPERIFPFPNKLTNQISLVEWSRSMLQQPRTFVRVRPGSEEKVIRELQATDIPFTKMGSNVLSFTPGKDLSRVISMDEDGVIQDFNSAKTLSILTDHDLKFQNMWDCCAGSGGKSILFHDLYPDAEITVSDTRKQILHNLKTRFRKAGIFKYKSAIRDLAHLHRSQEQYEIIIADVPCSGSGTWARTPEWLTRITEANLNHYPALQSKIVHHALPALMKNGYLLYITCSVYGVENEDTAARIIEKEGLYLLESRYLKGYDKGADTLYVALFQKR